MENIYKALRGEYILSHQNISPGLLAGNENPPNEWMNKRLGQLGENWRFSGTCNQSGNSNAHGTVRWPFRSWTSNLLTHQIR